MAIIELPHVQSTNTWAKENAANLNHGDIVMTNDQTAGRGQRGNSWEAEPGKNLTFSLMLHPRDIAPSGQFFISETVALAVADTVEDALSSEGNTHPGVTVKWPNDIYVGDRKIAGILIEHTLCGNAIAHSVAGIGLNVNQRSFLSDAPNPVSMTQLTGKEHPLEPILQSICDKILNGLNTSAREETHERFLRHLWRADGRQHPFATPQKEIFTASITGVAPSGELQLQLPTGEQRQYAFKEVAFIL